MLDIVSLGPEIAHKRKEKRLRQIDLAHKANVSRATVDALEHGRLGELGFNKVGKILSALGLELRVAEAPAGRPTLEDLMSENARDQGLDRRR